MPTLTIKGMPDQLYKRLKERATQHRRSLNSEILIALEQATGHPRPDAATWLARADALRAKAPGVWVTDEFLRAAKDDGRL